MLMTRIIFVIAIVNSISCQSLQTLQNKETSALSTGHQYARDGLFREAIGAYKKAERIEPRNLLIQKNLGIIYVKTGDYAKAIINLEKALRRYGNNFATNYYLGEAYRAKEKFGQAIYRYNRALELKPNNLKALKALAWSYYKVRFYAEALRTAQRVNRISDTDHQGIIIASRTLLKLGRHNKALALLSRAKARTKEGDLPYLLSVEGDIFFQAGQIEKAEATYREALKEQPLLAGALLGLAKCLLNSEGQMPQAIRYLERAVRIKPGLKEGLYMLGKHYERTNPKKSQSYYRRFKKYAATDPEFQQELNSIRKSRFPAPMRH